MRNILRLSAITAIACIPLVGCSDDDLVGLGPIGGGAGDSGSGGNSGSGTGGSSGSPTAGSGGMPTAGTGGSSGAAGTAGTGGTGNACTLTECGTDCVDTDTTEAHCGACDRACSNANASGATCGSGLCTATCNAGFADCSVDDGTGDDDGCETDLSQNATCGTTCEDMVACGVGEFCVDGECTATCSGTECGAACVTLATSSDHCNACDRACSQANVETRACVAGACDPVCNTGFGDCSADDGTGTDDGCETDLNTVETCGECGRACDGSNTTALSCTTGLCIPECASGFDDCNVDDGSGADDGCETDLSELESCGACGRTCDNTNTASLSCSAGACAPTCAAGFGDCTADDGTGADDGCETNLNDPVLCGTTCENRIACDPGQFCVDGACTDTCDLTVCDTACVDTQTSVTACGACDRACDSTNTTGLACTDGACAPTCSDGFGDCNADPGVGADGGGADDGCETDFNSDESCGTSCIDAVACGVDESCVSGVCTPDCEFLECGGECIDTDTSPEHCGDCDRVCLEDADVTSTSCSGGLCAAECVAGRADCSQPVAPAADDGCETALNTGASCGTGCGDVIACGPTQGCLAGVCVNNLITNSTFEAGFSPWAASFGGTISATTEQAHSGLQSGKVSGRDGGYQGAFYNLTGIVTQGATYSVRAFGRIGGAATGTLTLTAHRVCGGVDGFATIRSVTGSSTAWTELANTFTVPTVDACASMTRFEIYLEGPPAGVDIYIDDVVVSAL